MIEIYCEKIKDLLDPARDNLQVHACGVWWAWRWGWGLHWQMVTLCSSPMLGGAGRVGAYTAEQRCHCIKCKKPWHTHLLRSLPPLPATAVCLQVVQDKERGVIVSDATELPVASEAECVKIMELGLSNRAGTGQPLLLAVWRPSRCWPYPSHAISMAPVLPAEHQWFACCLCGGNAALALKARPHAPPHSYPPTRRLPCCAVSATAMNAGSSRSHCIVYILCEKAFPDGRVEYGKLALVVGGGRCWLAEPVGRLAWQAGLSCACCTAHKELLVSLF